MTANSEESRDWPAWAEGLDLGPKRVRAFDHTLKRILGRLDDHDDRGAWRIVLRRLADAEMKLAELQADRGEPDFLIDRDGEAWRRVGVDSYEPVWRHGAGSLCDRAEVEIYGSPVTAVWK